MGIANLTDNTLRQCYSYDTDKNSITIYLKGITQQGPIYFNICTQVNRDSEILSKAEVIATILGLLSHPDILNDFQSKFYHDEVYLSTQEEAYFFMDLPLLLEAKKFKPGKVIGKYNDKLIYETIQVKDKLFEYLGIGLMKDILTAKYNLIDNKLIICYNEIAYQLKGEVN